MLVKDQILNIHTVIHAKILTGTNREKLAVKN